MNTTKISDLFETMIGLYRSQGIQVFQLDEDFSVPPSIDYGFRGQLLENFDYETIKQRLKALYRPDICYLYEDPLRLYYTLVSVPPELVSVLHTHILCLGPVLFNPISTGTLKKVMGELQVGEQYASEFQEFYNRIPQYPSLDHWKQTLFFLLSRMFPNPPQLQQIDRNSEELSFFPYTVDAYKMNENPEVAYKTIEERYRVENQMLQAVMAGNFEQAIHYNYQFRQFRIVPRTPDSIRNQKNLLFVLNSLLRKAVENCHVHPLYIDHLSCQFAIQIEGSYSKGQLDALSHSMLRKYCMLVNNYSRQGYSSLIQTCLDYIDFYYYQDLSLDVLSKMCVVSNSYLSTLFKKEVGITVTDYINRTRIRQALTLLNSTTLSVGEISARCGFADANYFSRTFKKLQGKTPKAYRDSITGIK